MKCILPFCCFFHVTATTVIYTLSLQTLFRSLFLGERSAVAVRCRQAGQLGIGRLAYDVLLAAETATEHGGFAEIGRAQSELQSHSDLVCRLLLEKKNAPRLQ